MKRRIALALIAVLLVSLCGCGKKEEVPELLYPMETANAVCVVKKAPFTMVQSTGGYVVPECVDMKFDFDTSAYKVGVELGDHVTEGQLLMELNPELEDTIKRLELLLVREQTEYDYDYEQFSKQMKNLRNFANMLGGSYDGRMMKLQMQEMQLNFDKSHADLQKKIEKDREELAKLKLEAGDAKVYAPCTGTVVYINVREDGDEIREGKTFLTIAKDNTKLLACSYVSKKDYDSFTEVKAKIGEDVYDVEYIPYTEEEVYNLERTGNRFDSYFSTDLKDSVNIGDYVQFVFTKTSEEPVISVPTAAITKYGTQASVMIVREGYMESREVTLGEVGLNDTEILHGLSEGEVVYVAKNLARYGIQYETKKATYGTFSENIGCTGGRKFALEVEPFKNPVPGKISEINVEGISDIVVKKGDPIFTVSAEIGRANQEQAKLDLRKYNDEYEEKCDEIKKQIEELEKKMKKMSKSSLEYALAELDRNDFNAQLEELSKQAEEDIAELEKRIENFEAWNEQTVVLYADRDCVISSISKYKVGSQIAEGEVLFEMYDLDSFCISIDRPSDDNRLRYGQSVMLNSAVGGEDVMLPARIISAPNVRPNDATDKNVIYVALENPEDYVKTGPTGVVYYDEFGVSDCLIVDESAVYHDPKQTTQTKPQTQNQNQGFGGWGQMNPQEEEYEEAESFTFDSEEHELSKGKAFVWVYDEEGCAVKRYVRVLRVAKGKCWIVDGLSDRDTILLH